MAEDDPDDRLLIKEGFKESRLANDISFVENGVKLLDYLHRQGKYKNLGHFPEPDLILLDLNMPLKDGRESLEEIKADPHLRHIPVVVLTTSKAEEDILQSYENCAAGFISKPGTFNELVKVIQGLQEYWTQIVRLPAKGG